MNNLGLLSSLQDGYQAVPRESVREMGSLVVASLLGGRTQRQNGREASGR